MRLLLLCHLHGGVGHRERGLAGGGPGLERLKARVRAPVASGVERTRPQGTGGVGRRPALADGLGQVPDPVTYEEPK